MTVDKIKELVKSPVYDFLRNDSHLGDHIILLGLGGSHAYGTNIETSDVDIRGCAINSKEEILLGENFEQVTNKETDTTIYSFNKLITLLMNNNPNVIEMLGLRSDHYLYLTEAGRMLIDNYHLFLSKKCINSFGGYALSQLYRLKQLEAHSMGQAQLEEHILKSLEFIRSDFSNSVSKIPGDALHLYIDKSDREEMDTEIYMDVVLHHYPLRDYLGVWNTLNTNCKQYNKIGARNSKAIEHGKISKHMMHLVRLYLMCLDILEKEEIVTYREKDHDFLMEIRNGKYVTNENEVLPEFYDIVDEYEKKLEYAKEHTNLPEKPDFKRIREFKMTINDMIVKGKL